MRLRTLSAPEAASIGGPAFELGLAGLRREAGLVFLVHTSRVGSSPRLESGVGGGRMQGST
jgi:hypothetical protein